MVNLRVDLRRARRDAAAADPHRRRPARRARPAQGAERRRGVSLLEVRDLSIDFGPRRVVNRASFTLDAGEKFALVGESASGKTVTALSTLRLIENAGLSGEIFFDGKDVLRMLPGEMNAMRGGDVAVIVQGHMSGLNLYANVGGS